MPKDKHGREMPKDHPTPAMKKAMKTTGRANAITRGKGKKKGLKKQGY